MLAHPEVVVAAPKRHAVHRGTSVVVESRIWEFASASSQIREDAIPERDRKRDNRKNSAVGRSLGQARTAATTSKREERETDLYVDPELERDKQQLHLQRKETDRGRGAGGSPPFCMELRQLCVGHERIKPLRKLTRLLHLLQLLSRPLPLQDPLRCCCCCCSSTHDACIVAVFGCSQGEGAWGLRGHRTEFTKRQQILHVCALVPLQERAALEQLARCHLAVYVHLGIL